MGIGRPGQTWRPRTAWLAAVVLSGCIQTQSEHTAANDREARIHWSQSCKDWDDWNRPGPPFRIHANSFYVGTCGISSVLITGPEGHILIDGGPEESADTIAENIKALGFDLTDIKLLLHSHEHFDHVAALAELQRRSGAKMLASEAAAPVLASGINDPPDPQFGMHDPFPAVEVDGRVRHGEVVRLGPLALTAIATPGHTPGALSWHWQSCDG